jgi:hypothetical protein
MGTLRQAAIAQVVLEGVALPAKRRELVRYARRQHAAAAVVAALEQIPDREYQAIDEVGEAIARVQPRTVPKRAHEPEPESGEGPGGSDYLDPDEDSGAIRDEPTILPYEEQLVREPAPVGEGVPEQGSKDSKPGGTKAGIPAS